MNTAVLQRELRRLVRSRAMWAISVGLGFTLQGARHRDAPVAGALISGAAACMALYWAHRSMQAELEEETIEHLGTLPLSPLAIVFQIGCGAATAALMYSLVALLVACPRPLCGALDAWARGAALAYALGWMGAMGAFRYGETLVGSVTAMGPMAMLLGTAFSLEATLLTSFPTLWSIVGSLALGAGTTLICYLIWKARGGQWVESILPRTDAPVRRDRPPDEPLEPLTPAPDWSSPVFWYELCHNRNWLLVYALAPAAVFLFFGAMGMVNAALQQAIVGVSLSLGTFYVTLTAAGRAAQHRRTGLWADLAVTPMATRKIVLAQAGGLLARASAILLCWMLAAWIAAGCDAEPALPWIVPAILCWWAHATLCGYSAGAYTTGWKAGLLGIAIVYMSLSLVTGTARMVSMSVLGLSRPNELVLIACAILWSLAVFSDCVRCVAKHQA